MTLTDNGNGNYTLQFTPQERVSLAVLVAKYGAEVFVNRLQQFLEQGDREQQEQVREAWAQASASVKARVKSDLGL
jgi:hypothetical protein